MLPKATTNPLTKKGHAPKINPRRTNKVRSQLLQFVTIAIYVAAPISNLRAPKLVKMINLAGLHRNHNQKRRQGLPRWQRDGMPNHGHTFDNASRREINDFLDRLREIQESRKQTKWRPDGPQGKEQFVFALRKAEIQSLRRKQYRDRKNYFLDGMRAHS